MDRRFAVRYEELMADAEVKPEALEGVLDRLKEFVAPFAASLNPGVTYGMTMTSGPSHVIRRAGPPSAGIK